MYHATCPECKNDINLENDKMEEGDHFECSVCGITLEAHSVNSDTDPQEIQNPEIVEEEK